jgi:hypothetical protein
VLEGWYEWGMAGGSRRSLWLSEVYDGEATLMVAGDVVMAKAADSLRPGDSWEVHP